MTQLEIIEDAGDARVPASDRGLQYGDGLYETIACRGGEPRLLQAHLARLAHGCARLRFPELPCAALESAVRAAARRGGPDRALVKLLLTRGSSPERGYAPPASPHPRCLVQVHPWPADTELRQREGIAVQYSPVPLTENPLLAGLKHLNRLDSVLARAALAGTDCQEALLCAADGSVVCGSQSNLFVVMGGRLLTPPIARGGIAGIARAAMLEEARAMGWEAGEAVLHPAELEVAEEVFVTNVRIGAWPVLRLGSRRWALGERTRVLQQRFEAITDRPGPAAGPRPAGDPIRLPP